MEKNLENLKSKVQSEALINELKGNLFEYLVAASLARHYGIEKQFVSSFTGKIKRQLSDYEFQLRQKVPNLIVQLPLLAKQTAVGLVSRLPKKIDQLFVVGKIAGGGGNKSFAEADLLLQHGVREVPVSLKLSKISAFVNTKSGGLKSFLQKYFHKIEDAGSWQLELNQVLEKSYSKMACELHELADLKFNGNFDHRWRESGYSELPGQLSKEMNAIVVDSYRSVIAVIHKAFLHFHQECPEVFLQSLLPLMGAGNEKIIQAICFYRDKIGNDKNKSRYHFEGMHVFDYSFMREEVANLQIKDLKRDISSFEIYFSNIILQIRVKPMNKFVTKALKVNCSLKILS